VLSAVSSEINSTGPADCPDIIPAIARARARGILGPIPVAKITARVSDVALKNTQHAAAKMCFMRIKTKDILAQMPRFSSQLRVGRAIQLRRSRSSRGRTRSNSASAIPTTWSML
jgi:hypothetical protein